MKRASQSARNPRWWHTLSQRLRALPRATGTTVDHLLVGKLSAARRPTPRQMRFLFKVLTAKERGAFLALVLCAVVSGVFVIRQLWHWIFMQTPQAGGTYTEAIAGAPEYLNPLYATTNDADRDLIRLLFAGLVRYNERGEVEPYLAETVTASPDGGAYTITLRPGLTWSDGEPVTSDDVRFTVEAIKNPAYRSPLKSNFNAVQVETVDERTFRVILATTSAPFIENLTVGILPAHVWASVSPKNALLTELNSKPVSVGPYQFESLAKDPSGQVRSYSLVRRTQGVPHVPFIERIVLKYYPDIEEAVNAFKNRNGDGLALLPPSALAGTLKIRSELQHYRLRLPQYIAIFFNVKENAALDNARVRKALSLAVDRQRIIAEVLQGEGMRIESPFVPGSLGYDAYASTTSFDLAAAGALLDQEGWTLPEGEAVRMQGKAKQPLAVTLTTIGQPEQFTTAELVQRDWQALGVKVDLQIVDPANIFDLVRPRAYQALLVSEITGVDPDPYPFWHSSGLGEQGLNLANFSEREADILLEDARKTNDRGVREEKYRAFQRILYRETPAIFLSAPLPAYTVDKKVRGITLGGLANPSDRFAHIEQWYIKTKWKLR